MMANQGAGLSRPPFVPFVPVCAGRARYVCFQGGIIARSDVRSEVLT